MAPPSFDVGFSSLLCAEDNNITFDDTESYGGGVIEVVAVNEEEKGFDYATWHLNHNQSLAFTACGVLPMQIEECLALMVEKQNQHLPNVNYLKRLRNGDLDLSARSEAVDWMVKAHRRFNFGPLCAYLAISYMDRFLSASELPKGGAWAMQLLAVACLSLAAKFEEPEVPFSLDLQVDGSKYVFEARTIKRMELHVLSTLSWRMQAITPFSFMDHFLYKINNEEIPPRSLIFQSIQLILSTIKGIDFLEFRPSEIAAAVAIVVVGKTKRVDIEQAIAPLTPYVEKERVVKCIKVMKHVSLIGEVMKVENGLLQLEPQSPIGVLEAPCLSYRSDETNLGGSS